MATGVVAATGSLIDLDGVTLCMAEWELELDPGLVDATSFCDGGYAFRVATVKDLHGSVRGFWNVVTNPHAVPPNIRAGALLSDLKLYPVSTNLLSYWDIPSLIIDRVRVVAAVRDALKLDFDFYSQGAWVYPV